MHRELDGDSVLLNLETGVYYGLNETGSFIWSMLAETPNLGAVHDRLKNEYSADTDEIWADLVGLIDQLLERNLVCLVENPPSSGHSDTGV